MRRFRTTGFFLASAFVGLHAVPAHADVDPLSGIDFVTIGAVGNQPWTGANPPILGDMALGRGRVDYEYRIGRFEVTTAQWVEFMSAAFDRPVADRIPWLNPQPPSFWGGAGAAPNTPGGRRWTVAPGQEMRPVGNISWRAAAIYCNWLHNGKSLDRSAFLNGAYDVSTFGGGEFEFTDQLTHHPDARYWIPTWNEWLKAAHYDPNKVNPDGSIGGWWLYSNGTDTPLVAGPPGVGEANYGFVNGTQFSILLGAYPQTQSPWGLLDVAGATTEWTEGVLFGSGQTRARVFEGSFWASSPGFSIGDAVYASTGSDGPTIDTFQFGVRVATAVPAPSSVGILVGFYVFIAPRRRLDRRCGFPRSV
jgi:formylglycine-generating enzyme required for sulfatase activity